MNNGYVVLFIRRQENTDKEIQDVLTSFKTYKIKHKVVDLTEKVDLYGCKVSLEGSFALDFSQSGGMKVPLTPLVSAEGRVFSGSEEIKKNLEYLQEHFSDK